MKNYIGIDISQHDFWVVHATSAPSGFAKKKIDNTAEAIAGFVSKLGPSDHCILEATGNYSLRLTYALVEAGIEVSVINPSDISSFRKLMRTTWKDDPADARLLCIYGQKMKPKPFSPLSKELLELKQKRALLRQVKQKKVDFQNFIHSLKPHPFQDVFTLNTAKEVVDSLEKTIQKIKNEIAELVKEAYQELLERVSSVKGIGQHTAWALIEATQGFKAFQSPKQFAKFIGVAPTYTQSGTSVRFKSRINRSGDPKIRATLYLCAWSAIRFNKPCKELYERLKLRGKPSKVALVAVINKLIRQVFAVVQKDVPFDNEFEEEKKQEIIDVKLVF